jgi:hypothetical protein
VSDLPESIPELKPRYLPEAPQYGIRHLLGITFLAAGFCGAWTGSYWAFCLGMCGFMFLLARAMTYLRPPAMRVTDAKSESEAIQLRDKLQASGFRAATVADRPVSQVDRVWYVVVSAIQARPALDFLVGPHADGEVLPVFTNARCVFLADNRIQADLVANWLATQGIPASALARSAALLGLNVRVPANIPVFVEHPADAELAIDRIARQSTDAAANIATSLFHTSAT